MVKCTGLLGAKGRGARFYLKGDMYKLTLSFKLSDGVFAPINMEFLKSVSQCKSLNGQLNM